MADAEAQKQARLQQLGGFKKGAGRGRGAKRAAGRPAAAKRAAGRPVEDSSSDEDAAPQQIGGGDEKEPAEGELPDSDTKLLQLTVEGGSYFDGSKKCEVQLGEKIQDVTKEVWSGLGLLGSMKEGRLEVFLKKDRVWVELNKLEHLVGRRGEKGGANSEIRLVSKVEASKKDGKGAAERQRRRTERESISLEAMKAEVLHRQVAAAATEDGAAPPKTQLGRRSSAAPSLALLDGQAKKDGALYSGGNITIEVHQARNLPHVQGWGTQDPYVRVTAMPAAQKSEKSGYVPNGGTHPIWFEAHGNSIEITPTGEDNLLMFEVLNSNYAFDDEVSSVEIPLEALPRTRKIRTWIPLDSGGILELSISRTEHTNEQPKPSRPLPLPATLVRDRLFIEVNRATNLKNVHTFMHARFMAPYTKVTLLPLDRVSVQSQIIEQGGTTPVFPPDVMSAEERVHSNLLVFAPQPGTDTHVRFEVWDRNTFTSDELIGRIEIRLDYALLRKGMRTCDLDIWDEGGAYAGTLRATFAYGFEVPATVSAGNCKVGQKVQRGPDWNPELSKHGDQDGGRGAMGTVVGLKREFDEDIDLADFVPRSVIEKTPTECAIVQWDVEVDAGKTQSFRFYKTGSQQQYQLRAAGVRSKADLKKGQYLSAQYDPDEDPAYVFGQQVYSNYQGQGKEFLAEIVGVTREGLRPTYSVMYQDGDTEENVTASSLSPLSTDEQWDQYEKTHGSDARDNNQAGNDGNAADHEEAKRQARLQQMSGFKASKKKK
jgi:hypothetical protein